MNLTSYISQKVVRDRIRQAYDRPESVGPREPLVSQQIGTDPRLIGTAFDYLLRFHVERLNPGAISKTWVSEAVVLAIEKALANGRPIRVQDSSKRINGKMCEIYGADEDPGTTARKVRNAFERARTEYRRYISGGPLRRELLSSCCVLARLDWMFRRGLDFGGLSGKWNTCKESELIELRQLLAAVDPGLFAASKRCVLNPRFQTNLLAADGDLLIDDKIIEIKVVSRYRQDQRDWDQLFGYYALYRHAGVEGVHRNAQIRHLGIYSARFAKYQEIDISGEQFEKIEKLSKWMIGRLQCDKAQWDARAAKWATVAKPIATEASLLGETYNTKRGT